MCIKKRLLSYVMVAAMLCSLVPFTAMPILAANPKGTPSGTCGKDLTWTLDNGGALLISGTGTMTDFAPKGAPWYSSRNNIKTVVIEDGVTAIGTWAFNKCINLTGVTIPMSVMSIGDHAFYDCSNLTVYGYTGTAAYDYAFEEGIPFITIDEELPPLLQEGKPDAELTDPPDSTASVFSSGNLAILLGGCILLILAVGAVAVVSKKKKNS